MESSTGGSVASGNEQEASNSSGKEKKAYHRHTAKQIEKLEAFYKQFQHPDENQRRHLSRELGLEARQIKFWFQNKRTQTKTQIEKADNSMLRAQNERIMSENMAIREALKNVICPACGGPPFGEEERQRSLQKLQLENDQLKEEHAKISNLLAKYIGRPITSVETMNTPVLGGAVYVPRQPQSSGVTHASTPETPNAFAKLRHQPCDTFSEMEKAVMLDAASNAMEELLRLFQEGEPFWVNSNLDEKLVLNRDLYQNTFRRENHFKGTNARFESSKETGIVSMNVMKLLDMVLDPNKWADLFPTMVTEAKTILMLHEGDVRNRSGSLQLMYEQMHILSPMVPSREFIFLRFCQKVESGVWVIGDVSYEFIKDMLLSSRCWRLPSGCMIQDMPNGFSQVTWVEHVEVDDKIQTHRLYRDLICHARAYGAERWIASLRRMSERLLLSSGKNIVPNPQTGPATGSILALGHRMVKRFCANLCMSTKMDNPNSCEVNNSGIRIFARKNTEIGEPFGLIVSAATSFWLPLPPDDVFTFFTNDASRFQWDVLSNGNPVQEMARFPSGSHPRNFVSLIQPCISTESNILVLQESCTDKSSSLLVYAPIDVAAMNLAINGQDCSTFPLLPSGIIISGDGRREAAKDDDDNDPFASASEARVEIKPPRAGTLITVAYQILVASSSNGEASMEANMDSLATINTLISSTVQKIKLALSCSSLD